MGWRVLLGTVGLLLFSALSLGDARALRRRVDVRVGWVLAATAATVLAGFAHLALTPEHWDESTSYGLFFLVAGVLQLVLASVLARPTDRTWAWTATLYGNAFLVGVYAVTRLVGDEGVDVIGMVTVGSELVAAGVGVLARRRMAVPAPPASRRG